MSPQPAVNDPRLVSLVTEVLGLIARRAVGRTLELKGPGRDIRFVVAELDLAPAESPSSEPPTPRSWASGLLQTALQSAADPFGTAMAAMEASIDAFEAFANAAGRAMWPGQDEPPGLTVRLLDGWGGVLEDVVAAGRLVSRLAGRCGPLVLDVAERPTLTLQHCRFEARLDDTAVRSWLPDNALPRWATLGLEQGHGVLRARRAPRLGALVLEGSAADGQVTIEVRGLTVAGRRVPLPSAARRRWTIDPSQWRQGLRLDGVRVEGRDIVLEGELDEWSEELGPTQLMEIRDRLLSALSSRGITVPLLEPPR